MVSCLVFDISSSYVPSIGSGDAQDLTINVGEFRPLKVRAINIEGVLLPSVLEPEDFSGLLLIFIWVDVSWDVGGNSDGFGDFGVGEAIGLLV